MSVLSIVDDPKEELKRKEKEQAEKVKNMPGLQFAATDQQKGQDESLGGEADGEEE